ncbi:MAG: hypothetical protein ACYCSP_06530 [Acidobacteriaceae bacterium]
MRASISGSLAAGRALTDLAVARPNPIPCFAEMSGANPVFFLPGALRQRGDQIAKNLYASITLGAGQFCTKAGLVFLPHDEAVGSQAIVRFARPVCYQNFPEHALPQELRSGNPREIWRMVDGNMTRESLAE